MNARNPLTVADLIAKLQELSPDAEVQVTTPMDVEQSVTGPAYDVEFAEIGSLKYVSLI